VQAKVLIQNQLFSTRPLPPPPPRKWKALHLKLPLLHLADFGAPIASSEALKGSYAPELVMQRALSPIQLITASVITLNVFQVDFDPSITSFSEILQLFWSEYTPGKPYSKQYMSAILYSDDKQRQIAEEAIEKKKLSVRDVHVHFAPLDKFYLAEDYHQKYYLQNSSLFEKLKIPRNNALVLANSFMATRLNGYFGGHGTYELFLSDLKGFPVDESVKTELKETVSKRMKVPLRCE